jgi:hypothetical protein
MYGPEVNVDDREDHGSNGNGQRPMSVPFHVRTASHDVPSRFIQPSDTMRGAVTGTRLIDENQLNNIIALNAWCVRWGVQAGIDKLLEKTNGLRSLSGYSIAAMLQAHTQIITSEGLGVPLGKKSRQEVDDVKRHRQRRDQDGAQDDDSKS